MTMTEGSKKVFPLPMIPLRLVGFCYLTISGAVATKQRMRSYHALNNRFQQLEYDIKYIEAIPEGKTKQYMEPRYQTTLKSRDEIAAQLDNYKWTAKLVTFLGKYRL